MNTLTDCLDVPSRSRDRVGPLDLVGSATGFEEADWRHFGEGRCVSAPPDAAPRAGLPLFASWSATWRERRRAQWPVQWRLHGRALADELFDQDGLDTVFRHARNVLTGAAVVAAGLYAIHHVGARHVQGMWTVHLAGYVVAMLGAVLLALNLVDGLRKLARRDHHKVLRLLAILFYVALSVRLTQVIIYFRAPL